MLMLGYVFVSPAQIPVATATLVNVFVYCVARKIKVKFKGGTVLAPG